MIPPILFYIHLLVQGFVVSVGGFYYKNLPRSMKLLFWLLAFIFVEALTAFILALFSIHNLWLSHISTIVEFVFIVSIFSSWFKHHHNLPRVLFVLLIIFGLIWIVSKFTFEPFAQPDGWTSVISKLSQIVFSCLLLVDVVKESNIEWKNDPRLWVASGVIIYSAGSLFLFALFNKMLQLSPARLIPMLSINWILMIISNLFFARGFMCKK